MNHKYMNIIETGSVPLGPSILFIVFYPDPNMDVTNKCTNIGLNLGYRRIMVSWLYSLTAKSAEHVLTVAENNNVEAMNNSLLGLAGDADKIVLAWGGYGEHKGRGAEVVKLLEAYKYKMYILGKTKTGQPAHPLKIKTTQELIKYEC